MALDPTPGQPALPPGTGNGPPTGTPAPAPADPNAPPAQPLDAAAVQEIVDASISSALGPGLNRALTSQLSRHLKPITAALEGLAPAAPAVPAPGPAIPPAPGAPPEIAALVAETQALRKTVGDLTKKGKDDAATKAETARVDSIKLHLKAIGVTDALEDGVAVIRPTMKVGSDGLLFAEDDAGGFLATKDHVAAMVKNRPWLLPGSPRGGGGGTPPGAPDGTAPKGPAITKEQFAAEYKRLLETDPPAAAKYVAAATAGTIPVE